MPASSRITVDLRGSSAAAMTYRSLTRKAIREVRGTVTSGVPSVSAPRTQLPGVRKLSTRGYRLPLGPKHRRQPPSGGALWLVMRPRRAGTLDPQHAQRLVPERARVSGPEEEARWHPRTGVRASLYTTAIYLLFACTGVG